MSAEDAKLARAIRDALGSLDHAENARDILRAALAEWKKSHTDWDMLSEQEKKRRLDAIGVAFAE
jgi:hypothetical protein